MIQRQAQPHAREKALKTTHLAPLTIHKLRHMYAGLARKSGADLRYAQKTMGHSTPTVTAKIFSDLYTDELDQSQRTSISFMRMRFICRRPDKSN